MHKLGKPHLILILLWVYTILKVDQIWPGHAFLCATVTFLFFIIMISWMFIYHAKPHLINHSVFRAFIWIGSLAMGFWSTYILLSIPVDIFFLANYAASWVTQGSYRIEDIGYWWEKINVFVLALSSLFSVLGLIETLSGPRVKKINISIPSLPVALNKLTIAQISDLHVGPTIRNQYVKKVVDITNALHPDLIFVTGDLTDANVEFIEKELEPLRHLKSRFGIYYVTGNHEYYWEAESLIQKIKMLGIIPLINENKIVNIDNTKLMIAGVTDPVGAHFFADHQPNLQKAIKSDEETQLKILLAHRPGVCVEAEKYGIDIQFSGHTHAGQYFPFSLLIPLVHKIYRGLNQYGHMWVYVNTGTGYWGPANRFGVSSEVTLVTLGIEEKE